MQEKIYEMGALLGLKKKEINSFLFDTSSSKKEKYSSNVNIYKDGSYYGTISIKDFK
jgi:hypothetical protein